MATLGEGDPRGDTWQESADNIPVIIINLAESSGARAEEEAVLNKKVEIVHNVEGLLEANPRLHVVREVSGGGELMKWAKKLQMFRGGGSFSDVIGLLVVASVEELGRPQPCNLDMQTAHQMLKLHSGLVVPADQRLAR
ncbi:hypothetical protein SAY86_001343 [Trapa natans]|uniref:Uncharacterized protein n=1 Tax=Trapa natans TaxID=22666 RepID=A0AAN7MVW0_TRANT|nr:hypothetical protein SAY86_001343 [Trapa natans]